MAARTTRSGTGERCTWCGGPVAGVFHPISVVRMAVGDAYGAEQWREGTEGGPDEVAFRTERISRDVCRAVAEYAFRQARKMGGRKVASVCPSRP